MSLRDTNSIDVVGKGPDGGYDLFIYDAGDIADQQERHHLLSKKLLTYAEYVASGQYQEQAPDASTESFTIRVICHSPPNESMRQITGIATREEPVVRIPIEFALDSEFRAQMLARRGSGITAETQKPWWRFW